MKNSEYETVEHIDSDLTLMLENAKRYNVPHSSIYKRALRLQHIQQVGSLVNLRGSFHKAVQPSAENEPGAVKAALSLSFPVR